LRLDKYLSSVTALSRSDAKKAIRLGRVSIAGEPQTDPRCAVAAGSVVSLDGADLRGAGKRYIMLNKPKGYVSATKDSGHLTVLQLLEEDNVEQLHIAGRLDMDTTGLLLISDDGQWSHRITSPNSGCKKTYLLEAADPIDDADVARMEQGMALQGELHPTLPAQVQRCDEHTIRITISQGRYHQLKRMLGATGNRVDELHRERIGAIELDPGLALGEYRFLTPAEIDSV
jgi:16S rRNA pseudouridine516 synthase